MTLTVTDADTLMGRVDQFIDEARYERHPFVSELESGRVPRERLQEWAVQKYHQTFLQNRCLSAIHTQTVYEDVRQYEMDQLIAEETGLADGSAAHYALMRRFAEALGPLPVPADEVPVAEPVRHFVDYLVGTCQREHFVYGLLAIYINERQTPSAVLRMRRYLVESLGMSEADVEWFTVHGEGDVEHAAEARKLILKYMHEAPGFAERAIPFVQAGLDEWARLQDFYASLIAPRAEG
jgi:pyrroloquinoline quinone (PQQ) biosynthesis protein C